MQFGQGSTRHQFAHGQARITCVSTPRLSSQNSEFARQQVAAAAASQWHNQIRPLEGSHSAVGSDISSCSNGRSQDSSHALAAVAVPVASVLHISAAAPRPASLPPEHMEASTSSSINSTAGSRGHQHSRGSSNKDSNSSIQLHNGTCNHSRHIAVLAATTAHKAAAADITTAFAFTATQEPKTASAAATDAAACSPSSNGNSGISQSKNLTDSGYHLMAGITQHTSTWQDLATLVKHQASHFTAQHCAAALHRLAALWQRQQQDQQQQHALRAELRQQRPAVHQLAAALMKGMEQQMQAAKGRDVADALCAAVNLGLQLAASNVDPTAVAGTTQQLHSQDALLQSSSTAHLVQQQQQEHHLGQSCSFANALLQHSQVLMRSGMLKPLPLSRVLWGVASSGLQPSRDWWATALECTAAHLEATLQQQQHFQEQQQWRQQQHPQQGYNAESIARIGWAIAKLQAPATDAWWGLYTAAAERLLPCMDPQQLSCCVWALSTARQVPSDAWMACLYAVSEAKLSGFTPQGLAVTLRGLAVLEQQPPQQWCEQFDAACSEQLYAFTAQHLSMTIWAAGRIARWSTTAAAAAGACTAQHTAADYSTGNSIGSSVHLQQQRQQHQHLPEGLNDSSSCYNRHFVTVVPSASWFDQAWSQLSRVESDLTPQGLACILWGLVQLQPYIQVPEQRMQQLERLVGEVLRDAEPQGLAVMIWAVGTLRGAATNRTVVKRLRRYCHFNHDVLQQQITPQGLLMLLHGLARVRAWHPDSFKQQLLAAVAVRLQHSVCQQQPVAQANSSSSSEGFKTSELPIVLLLLCQLKLPLPTSLLQQYESLLLPQLSHLTAREFATCIFAMGSARHSPSAAFLEAAGVQLLAKLQQCSAMDVAYVLYGLAAMTSSSEQLSQQQQQQWLVQLLDRAQQVVPSMDHSCLAMTMWAIARLQLRPSQHLIQVCLTATTTQLPHMTLVSITSILAALRSLHYLPPLAWMVETCNAARNIYNIDITPKPWQRRTSLRRLEDTVEWFTAMLQQQGEAAAAVASPNNSREAGVQRTEKQLLAVKPRGVGAIAGNTGSEAMIAAAVGVAAAVAQQLHL